MNQLRLLSYNIHKGYSFANRKAVLQQIRKQLRLLDPDIVFLQEVQGSGAKLIRKSRDWDQDSQVEFLAAEFWPFAVYGENAVYQTGHHGNAILSKFAVSNWSNIDISTNPIEKRGLLYARLELGNTRAVHCFSVHLDLLRRGRDKQLSFIRQHIAAQLLQNEALIVAGDFNDWTRRATPQLEPLGLEEAFKSKTTGYAETYPSWRPFVALDRVYLRSLTPRYVKVLTGLPWRTLSDHNPLLVEVDTEVMPVTK